MLDTCWEKTARSWGWDGMTGLAGNGVHSSDVDFDGEGAGGGEVNPHGFAFLVRLEFVLLVGTIESLKE